jgi:citrate lyase beta subunit
VFQRGSRVAACGLALVLFVACGTGRLSQEEFIAAADEICADMEREVEEMGKPRSQEEFEEFVERSQEITIQGIERIRELEPPEADEERIERMLDLRAEAVRYLPEVQRAVETQDFEAMQEIGTRIQEAYGEAQQIALEYGFRDCAERGVDPIEDGAEPAD